MGARIGVVALLGVILSCLLTQGGHAAVGLRCSDWLNARSYTRYDPTTKRYVEAKPKNARPVPKEVEEKSSFITAYAGGIIESYTWLDPMIQKMADIPGLKNNPKLTLPAFLDRVAELCRGSLQK